MNFVTRRAGELVEKGTWTTNKKKKKKKKKEKKKKGYTYTNAIGNEDLYI